MLARFPALTLVGSIAIAVAVALGATYFEAVNKWQNPRLPIADADRAISITNWDAKTSSPDPRMLHDFLAWREQTRTLDLIGAAVQFQRNLTTEDGQVEPVSGAEITANAFALMGTAPLLGRALTARDEDPAEPPVVVIGHNLWASRFASDRGVIGAPVQLGSLMATVVGVMPPGYGFPVNHNIWTALRADASSLAPRSGPAVSIFGRLAPGRSIEEARSEFMVIAERVAAGNPVIYEQLRPMVTEYARPIGAGQMLIIRNILYAVNGVFLLLLAIVCTNVATLVFARTAMRGWEITVRSALGATRSRIIAQLFVEALVLTTVAALIGLAVAKLGLRLGVAEFATRDALPFWINDSLSLRTIVYGALLAFLGAVIVGILPALRVTRINVSDAMRNEAAARSGLKFGGLWTAVIVVQVAITVAFLPLAAGGVFQSNRFSQRAEGIGAERFLIAGVSIDRENYIMDSSSFATHTRRAFVALQERLLAEPGVEQVAFADRVPVEDQFKYTIDVDTAAGAPATGMRRSTLVNVSGDFFRTFGTSLLAGRGFEPLDFEAPGTMIVNESFARHVLGDRNPIGQRIRIVSGEIDAFAGDQWYEIIGMVENFGWQLPEAVEQSAMYLPSLPGVGRAGQLVVRTNDLDEFANRIRRVAAEADPTIQLSDVKPLALAGGGEAQMNWALTWIAWLIGFVVLLLSATGIHSLMSFTVARRTREIGIRAALGAGSGRIVRGIFRRAFIQIGLGVVAGSGLAALFGLGSARQVLILLAADAVMLIVGLAACAVPLRRALMIDPTEALRAEG